VAEHPLLLDGLDPGAEVCVQLRPYDLSGTTHDDATSEPACGTVPELRIDSVEPSRAVIGEPTELTIQGAGFRASEDFMLSLCDYELFEIAHASQELLVVTTRRDRPTEPGPCDLTASYANGLSATLEGAFEFVAAAE
jgi:hypothetical protein